MIVEPISRSKTKHQRVAARRSARGSFGIEEMKLNHVANRLDSKYFCNVIEIHKLKLYLAELRWTNAQSGSVSRARMPTCNLVAKDIAEWAQVGALRGVRPLIRCRSTHKHGSNQSNDA
jgi:hypothetical protein